MKIDQSFFDSITQEVSNGVDVKFMHNSRPVGLDCFDADEEFIRYLFVGEP